MRLRSITEGKTVNLPVPVKTDLAIVARNSEADLGKKMLAFERKNGHRKKLPVNPPDENGMAQRADMIDLRMERILAILPLIQRKTMLGKIAEQLPDTTAERVALDLQHMRRHLKWASFQGKTGWFATPKGKAEFARIKAKHLEPKKEE